MPDPFPFQHEPRSELFGTARRHFRLERFRADPAPAENLIAIDVYCVGAACGEDGAKLVLGASRIELRLVLELEQKMQGTAHAELFVESAPDRGEFLSTRPKGLPSSL